MVTEKVNAAAIVAVILATLAGATSTGTSLRDVDRQWSRFRFPDAERLSSRATPFTVNVEGIVGTGKSTFLNYFKVK